MPVSEVKSIYPLMHDFSIVLQVDAGLTLDSRKHQYDFMFDIRTPKRTFYLAAESKALMERWVDCICRVCGLKVYPRDGAEDGEKRF